MSFFMKYQRVSPPKPAGKVIFRRLLKKDQMQRPRNPESGVATNKERLFATPVSW
jgi:hypothetical protein